jgi:uncharacterized membrane protein
MPGPPGLTEALGRNIEAVSRRRADDAAKASGGVRLSSRIGRLIGRMGFVYAHLVALAGWIVINVGLVSDVRPFDPHFDLLGTVVSVEAIFLSIFILIAQNHEAVANDRRDDLNLQVSLLAEHELSRLIQLNIAIADKLGIVAGVEIADLQHDIHPGDVLDTIERAEDARKD